MVVPGQERSRDACTLIVLNFETVKAAITIRLRRFSLSQFHYATYAMRQLNGLMQLAQQLRLLQPTGAVGKRRSREAARRFAAMR